ncbi:MAG TPA: hypothetical protein VFY26_17300 [Anaerolineales bacterium]|nr:hypothetical protein [Anaerolineales bacterium]
MRERLPGVVLLLSTMLLSSCLLPGMIPMDEEPVMEESTERVIEVLSGDDWRPLQALAEEQYTGEDYASPGTLTYTLEVSDGLPKYFSYGWCAVDEATLVENLEHMTIQLSINGELLPEEVVHNLSFTSTNNLLCVDFGVLITEWPDGEYRLEAVATFEEPINDGLADFEAGDYIFIYNVTVRETDEEGAPAPSS